LELATSAETQILNWPPRSFALTVGLVPGFAIGAHLHKTQADAKPVDYM